MAREYMIEGQLSEKADILAFGACTRNHYRERQYRFITKIGIKATFLICRAIKMAVYWSIHKFMLESY